MNTLEINRQQIWFHIGMLQGMSENDQVPEEYRGHLRLIYKEMAILFRHWDETRLREN